MNIKLNNLQILRAFAALDIVVFHIINTSEKYGHSVHYLKLLAGWGGNGVDIFFVLSGFIMVYIQAGRKSNPVGFFLDRLIRIVPLYFLLTISLFLLINGLPQLFRSDPITIKNLVSSLLFIHGAFSGQYPVLSNGWTLEFEMFFYLLIAVALLFRNKTLTFISVILMISFSIIFLSLSPIAFEFLFGVFVGYLYLNTKSNRGLSTASLIVGISFLLMPIFIQPSGIYSQRVILSGVPAIFVIYGLIGIPQRKNGLLTTLGDASYSIYLIEEFTLPLFYKIVTFFNLGNKIPNDISALFCLVFTIVAGWGMYRVVEKPLTRRMRDVLKRNRSANFTIAAGFD